MKIYTMESFITYRLNETSFNKDEEGLPLYGPYAAALSYIVGYSHVTKDTPKYVYRGVSMTRDELKKYKAKKHIVLNGFKSASIDEKKALSFARNSVRRARRDEVPVLIIFSRVRCKITQ